MAGPEQFEHQAGLGLGWADQGFHNQAWTAVLTIPWTALNLK